MQNIKYVLNEWDMSILIQVHKRKENDCEK